VQRFYFFIKVFIFYLLIFIFSTERIFAFTQWSEFNLSPSVFWELSNEGSENEVVSGRADQVTPPTFLITKAEYFLPTKDFIWQFDLIPQFGVDHNLVWGFVDNKNYYQLHFSAGALWVNHFIGGQEMLARGINFNWNIGQSYLISISRKNGLLSILVDNVEVFHFYDWTYDEIASVGSWGIKMSPGSVFPVKTILKNNQINKEADESISLIHFWQNDPFWSDDIYDSASLWVGNDRPTISRWGCALTSAAMVLHFHGFSEFLSGEELNPASLNKWLIDQQDGYLGEGLVNWWAITRLTRILSDQAQSVLLPKLEFSFLKQGWREAAQVFLAAKQPVIAQIPGHFFVLNGFDQVLNEFKLLDPLFELEYEHEHEPIQSIRVFQPSFTDLSAIVVVHDPSVLVKFYNEEQTLIETKEWEENISTAKSMAFTVIEKPEVGKYSIEFITSDFDGELLESSLYTYTQDAEPTIHLIDHQIENNFGSQIIELNFEKNNSSSIEYKNIWESFLNKLNEYFLVQKITPLAKDRITKDVDVLKTTEIQEKYSRYDNHLDLLLKFYQQFNFSEIFQELAILKPIIN